MDETNGPSPEMIERLRESGIRIDRQGVFWHEGAPVEHAGLRAALHRWLDRLDDGRYVLRLDRDRFAYVDVDDTPLIAESLRFTGDDAWLALSDGSEERLDPSSLTLDREGTLRARVRHGRLEARLGAAAMAALADRLRETTAGVALTLGGHATVLSAHPR